jgi:hypothetical protein
VRKGVFYGENQSASSQARRISIATEKQIFGQRTQTTNSLYLPKVGIYLAIADFMSIMRPRCVLSSVGRALALHAGCRRFEPVRTHQISSEIKFHVAHVAQW